MKKVRGISVLGVIIIAAVVVIAAVQLIGFGGLGFGGGKGDGEGEKNADAVPVMAETSASETEPETTVTTQEIEYINITVDGNSYLYNNKKYDIEETEKLIGDIKALDEKLTVRITDDDASQKAYDKLTKLLGDNDYRYIEVSENEE